MRDLQVTAGPWILVLSVFCIKKWAVNKMGITVAQAIRLMLMQVVQTKRLPFAFKVATPNKRVRTAMEEQDRNPTVTQYESSAAFFKSLGIDEQK